jgi:hypothetical protein
MPCKSTKENRPFRPPTGKYVTRSHYRDQTYETDGWTVLGSANSPVTEVNNGKLTDDEGEPVPLSDPPPYNTLSPQESSAVPEASDEGVFTVNNCLLNFPSISLACHFYCKASTMPVTSESTSEYRPENFGRTRIEFEVPDRRNTSGHNLTKCMVLGGGTPFKVGRELLCVAMDIHPQNAKIGYRWDNSKKRDPSHALESVNDWKGCLTSAMDQMRRARTWQVRVIIVNLVSRFYFLLHCIP